LTYVTPDVFADEIGVTAKTVREWLRSGELVGIQLGKSWRIHRADIERFVEGQRLEALVKKAQRTHPDIIWKKDQCAQCGEAMVSPEYNSPWVCSSGCKHAYDDSLAAIVGHGTPEHAGGLAMVIPFF